jgi:hypothetical protein
MIVLTLNPNYQPSVPELIWPFFDSYPENGQFQPQKLRTTSQEFIPPLFRGDFLSPAEAIAKAGSFYISWLMFLWFIDENHPKIERFNPLVELISLQRKH